MRDNREDMLLVVDPFGFPIEFDEQRAQEYIFRLEDTLSKINGGLVQTVLVNPILELSYLHPFWRQEQAFLEKDYFDEIVEFYWVRAPHAPIAEAVYKQDKELSLDGKGRAYLCGAVAESCMLFQAGRLKRRSRGLDLSLVHNLILCESMPALKPYELRRLYKSHKIPVRVIMSQDLPFLR